MHEYLSSTNVNLEQSCSEKVFEKVEWERLTFGIEEVLANEASSFDQEPMSSEEDVPEETK